MARAIASSEYDVFISYNSADHASVEHIARGLTERDLTVFLDRWELVPGRSWPDALETHLGRCPAAAVVLGPSGMGPWQHRERHLALERQARDSSFGVIPVLLPGADPALGFLSLNTWVDLRAGLDDPQALDLLAAAIRGQAPLALLNQSRQAIAEVCPYRGLEVFREEDAPFFFGRETFTQRLAERIATRNFLAVVGSSGSGKSSVVRAGLVPLLRQGTNGTVWDVLTLVPGGEPLAALARAIDPPPTTGLIAARAYLNAAVAKLRGGEVTLDQLVADHLERQPGTDRLLLVIDQFEELVTLAGDGEDQTRFVDLLLAATGAVGPLSVLLTLRSDFYTQLVRRRDLNDRLQDAVVHIGPLSRVAPQAGDFSELEQIIHRPVESVGLNFEDGLVPRIVSDVGDEPGNLPLLEYLLTALWRRRGRGLLTHEAYDALGGVQGAIARRADEAYGQLSPEQQSAARRLFLSLVRPGEGQQDTRVPAPFPEALMEAEVARRFSSPKVRLLVAGDDPLRGRVVEVSHEALIRGWSRLRGWVDQNRETLRARERVRQRMHRWQEHGERADLLLPPGLELEEGRRLLETETDVSMNEVCGYIEQSIAAEESRIAERQARQEADQQRELTVQRQKRRMVSAALVVSLLLLALAGWQWWQAVEQRAEAKAQQLAAENARTEAIEASRQAKRQAERADRERNLAQAQRLATTAAKVLEENPGETGLAAMLAVESQAKRNTPEANAVLRDALALTPLEAPLLDYPWADARLQVSGDGRVLAFTNREIWGDGDEESRSSIHLLQGLDLKPLSVRVFQGYMRPLISPDGRWLVSAGLARRLVVTDLAKDQVVLDEPARSATFPISSPDSGTLYVARQTGEIEVRRAPGWKIAERLDFPVAGSRHVELEFGITPDGARLLVIDPRRDAVVVPTDGSAVTRLKLDIDRSRPLQLSNSLKSGIVSPVARLGLTRQGWGETRLWDLRTGTALRNLDVDERSSGPSVFSPDGQLVATTYYDEVFLRRVDSGATIRRWHHSNDPEGYRRINALVFSANCDMLVSAGQDGVVRILDIANGSERQRLKHDTPVLSLAFDPVDGTLLTGTASTKTEEGAVSRFDPVNGELLARQELKGDVEDIQVGGQNRKIVVGLRETWAKANWSDFSFIEHATGKELSHLSGTGSLTGLEISRDGSRFAIRDRKLDQLEIRDTNTGKALLRVPSKSYPLTFSPDGRRLLLERGYGPLLVLDTQTGQTLFELGEPGGIRAVFMGAQEDFAVTRGFDGSLRGWDLAAGKPRPHQVPQNPEDCTALRLELTTCSYYDSEKKSIEVLESGTGKPIGSIAAGDRGFWKNHNQSRLLTIHRIKDPESEKTTAHEAEIWNLRTAELVGRRRIDAEVVLSIQNLDPFIALVGTGSRDGKPRTWIELIDWETGEIAWSRSNEAGGVLYVVYEDQALDRILLQAPATREMRSLSTGELIWQEPGTDLRGAARIPNTSLLALADDSSSRRSDDVIRLVERETGEERRKIPAGGYVRDVAATADGAYVLATIEGERWRGIRAWRAADGRLVREIEMDAQPRAIFPLSDSNLIAVHDFAQNLRVFELSSGQQIHRIVHGRSTDKVAYASDADRAVTADEASLRYWDTRDGREIAHRVSYGDASSVSLSPDGRRVAYLTDRPRIGEEGAEFPAAVIWQPESEAEPLILPVDDVNEIRFDPTGRYLALKRRDESVRLVDARTLRTERTVQRLRNGRLDDLFFAADSRVLLVRETGVYQRTGSGESLRAIDIATGDELARMDFDGKLVPVPGSEGILFRDVNDRWRSFNPLKVELDPVLAEGVPDLLVPTPKSSRLLASSNDKPTFVYDLSSGRTLTLRTGVEPVRVMYAAIDPSGRFVALSLRERKWRENLPGEVIVLDASKGKELAHLQTKRPMRNILFVDGGNGLVLSELRGDLPKEPNKLTLYWIWRGGRLKTLVGNNPVRYLDAATDANRFATAEGNHNPDGDNETPIGRFQVRIWSSKDGTAISSMPLDFSPSRLHFSDDGRHVAVEIGNETLLLRTEDGSEATSLKGTAAGFAAEGRTLVIREDRGALLYDIDKESSRHLRDTQAVTEIAISADGEFLAMQGERLVSVWDVSSGEPLIRFEAAGLKDYPKLTFAGANGKELIGVGDGKIVRLRWQPEELKQLACRVFADGNWRQGRARVIGETGPHPCD